MYDFFMAALPWLAMGLTVAVVCAAKFTKKKGTAKTDKEDQKDSTGNYMTEGMAIGMCLGAAVGTASGQSSIGMSMGMVIGMAVGMSIKK